MNTPKPASEPFSSKEEITRSMERLSLRLLSLCRCVQENKKNQDFFERMILGELLQESMRIEEILDSFGALKNRHWFPYREAVAGIKLLSSSLYTLVHIHHSFSSYNLLPIKMDIAAEYKGTFLALSKNLMSLCINLINLAEKAGIEVPVPYNLTNPSDLSIDHLILPQDKKLRHIKDPGSLVINMASTFLNLSEQVDLLESCQVKTKKDWEEIIPEIVSEEKLRKLEGKFHNLQSLYDTNIIDSDIEQQDSDLRILRGHISIIFHLFEASVALIHYYERHITAIKYNLLEKIKAVVNKEDLLYVLFNFLIPFTDQYISVAKDLCRRMIKRYAKIKEIEVPIPNYRGFHVRPSTLIAKIVIHYGSEVQMIFNGKEYNAGMPLELFRVNEEINAIKRRRIAEFLSKYTKREPITSEDLLKIKKLTQLTLLELAEHNEIVLYTHNFLKLEDVTPSENEEFKEFMNRVIAFLMASGKLDINSSITVAFKGDQRVLDDIKILAENGYGEDKFGNNIVLPSSLSYLRK